MPINPSIALSIKPMQFESPINAMTEIMQLKGAQQANALNQMKMDEARRGMEEQNALRAFLPNLTPGQEHKLLGYGSAGANVYEKWLKGQKDLRETKKLDQDILSSQAEVTKKNIDIGRELLTMSLSNPDIYPAARSTIVKSFPQFDASIPQQFDPAMVQKMIVSAESMRRQIEEQAKPKVVAPGATIVGPGNQPLYTAPQGDTTTQREYNQAVQQGFKGTLVDYKKQLANAARSVTNVNLPTQEKAFEQELGKGQAQGLMDSKKAADDAVQIIDTVKTGRKILNAGMVTGFGAEAIVSVGQALKQAGIDFGGDATSNAQAYSANMAQNVGKLIKQFGAGTGLSNADREYAEKMAGGKITLDETAIRKILDINERAARNLITGHNKRAQGIKTNVPLTVELPEEPVAASKGAGAAPQGIPQAEWNVMTPQERALWKKP